jgi:hypothetical protein
MNTVNLAITYRPVRIGWCVELGNHEDVRRAIRWTHTLWGGRYNPIIPVGQGIDSAQLVKRFQVDVLFPVREDGDLIKFADSFSYLRWPSFRTPGFFVESDWGKETPFLGIAHPVYDIHDKFVKGEVKPRNSAVRYLWGTADPLADVFLVQYGDYPPVDETGINYGSFVTRHLSGSEISIAQTDAPPSDSIMALTPSKITIYDLEPDGIPHNRQDGFYVGRADSFEDIVNFWNLRAADQELYFFDRIHEKRLAGVRDAYIDVLQHTGGLGRPQSAIGVWTAKDAPSIDSASFGKMISGDIVQDFVPHLTSPLMQFSQRSAFGHLSEFANKTIVSFQMPEKPFRQANASAQEKMVVGIRPTLSLIRDPDKTLTTLFLPDLNDFYRRAMMVVGDEVRVQRDGFGIITSATADDLSFFLLDTSQLVTELFKLFGINAEPSVPGRIAKRIIQQMGGLQGCRVFKLPGVRKLIKEYGPLHSFTRSAATLMIAQLDPITRMPNLPVLFVEGNQLTPASAFDYLLSKGVFRAGLELTCPNCELEFWVALEGLGHEVTCEYCGQRFNLSRQLKDRDWRFRRSGLFGREDNQEGALPVVLTLQQLETNISSILGVRLILTSFKLSSAGAKISPCETDLLMVTQDLHGKIEIAIGECKSSGPETEITDEDVRSLVGVAGAFASTPIDVFTIFAKTGPFTDEEVKRCSAAQVRHAKRVILLSDRELEPYHVYERTHKEFNISQFGMSLDQLAKATPDIFFHPKRMPSSVSSDTTAIDLVDKIEADPGTDDKTK